MEFSGFFTSWATPAVTRPSAARLFGDLELAADALDGLDVAQADERAHARAVLADHLHVHADALRPVFAFEGQLLALRGRISSPWICSTLRNGWRAGTISETRWPGDRRRTVEKLLDRRADEDRATFGIEEKQAVAHTAHHLIQIFAQGAENFANVAQLLSDADDLGADGAEFIAAFDRGAGVKLALRDAVQLRRDALIGASAMRLKTNAQSVDNRTAPSAQMPADLEAGRDFAPNQGRGKANANIAKR